MWDDVNVCFSQSKEERAAKLKTEKENSNKRDLTSDEGFFYNIEGLNPKHLVVNLDSTV